jgi:mannosyltransferase OCH1-like enzyme
MVCPSCYREIVCGSKSENTDKKQVEVNVTVRQVRHLASGEQRIPKVIHQTWFDEPSVDRYPQLARLQNSWKSQGWEYRFYRDEDIRAYIAKHFPPRFLDAFDSVIPGAFKASSTARCCIFSLL